MPSSFNPGGKSIGTPSVAVTGTPSSGQVPTATGAAAATWQTPGGGSGAPANVVLTYQSGVLASGEFKPNNSALASTTSIVFSKTGKNGGSPTTALFDSVSSTNGGTILQFANTAGVMFFLSVSSITAEDGTSITLAVNPLGTGTWSGDYQIGRLQLGDLVTVASVSGKLIPADTGWVANASVGDKTQVVADYAAGSLAGADTVDIALVETMGGQVAALTLKLQAIQTALAATLRPNA